MTQQERKQKQQDAAIYNANLTEHLGQRMIYNPDNIQYRKDYENRFKKFRKVA